MKKWSYFFLTSAVVFILVYLIYGFAIMLGVLSIWLFIVYVLWDMADTFKICGVPYCEKWATLTVKTGPEGVLHLCQRHFKEFVEANEYVKRGVSRPFFTEERKRRMFNPNAEEKKIMDYLVEKGILELALIRGKPSFKPTERFSNLVTKVKINILLKGYVLDLRGQTEEGIKIAMKQSIKRLTSEEAEKYSEIACPFVYWEEMDRQLNPLRRRKKQKVQKDITSSRKPTEA